MAIRPPSVSKTSDGLPIFIEEGLAESVPRTQESNSLAQEEDSDWSMISGSSSTDETQPLSSTPDTSINGSFSTSSVDSDHVKRDSVSSNTELILDEDPSKWIFDPDHSPEDIEYISGNIVGATVAALVEKLTPPDGVVDAAFSSAFFLTFRLFSSPSELAEIIEARYNLPPPPNISEIEAFLWQEQKGSAVRKGVLDFSYTWLDQYWQPGVDNAAFPALERFTASCLAEKSFPEPGIIYPLTDLLNMRLREGNVVPGSRTMPKPTTDEAADTKSGTPKRRITRELLNLLRKKDYAKISFMDFDPLELARQLTLMGSELFCAIHPDEILQYGSSTNISAWETFSTSISNWVSESILHELNIKRRTWLVKFFIKIVDFCVQLCNFTASHAILSALKSPSISQMHLTMSELPQESKIQLESLIESQNSFELHRIPSDNTSTPRVPYLGWYISAIASCREFFPSHRQSSKELINLARYYKLAEIWQDFQRFQTPYNLKSIPELQVYLTEIAFKISKHLVYVQKAQVPPKNISTPSKRLTVKPSDFRESFPSFADRFSLRQIPPPLRRPPPRQSTSTTHSSSVATIYSNPHSSIGTLDYGIFYTRRAFSQDSIATPEWWAVESESGV